MTEDPWDTMSFGRADHAAEQAAQQARERRTMAELLMARGQRKAAAIVAVSGYRSDCVDNWDGGQYEVVLSVPAAQFDAVDEETRAAMEAAARAVTGAGHFFGLDLEVQLLSPQPDWERELFERLFRVRDTADAAGLEHGGDDAN